ncbi:ADP-forming succinate--CoA ligase subunit beta [Chloroflexus aggregans]|uniref:Succinate--CoA ligase [ADP-forming] subunit beta n=1 Tax=Chloroflexus aggregans (strain MD-66 / DSM 9485) TaxID=326427 RepID=SUCC_CHLAD|nr:ADP-forming succinate--CoA ligase subunit beta [Chloroflexus aggregans]B8GCC9.1 RecName: Full=Succinate--CoA ligase [ADP-forming] subunit beta; AltName: Full=Succinyl-CoA synthetase subunit beta; Short=SCS-beta [Chloroflexus aggregans DSM 9485]ACL24973.1 succinyl-CoA synthetase, beta subunit [Chloroflexus aggregans DSM 9485]
MKLHEYQARDLLARYGIPVTGGGVAVTPAEAHAIAEQIGGPVVVKAQVHVGGRGKAGGVKLAQTPAEAEQVAGQILGMNIKGLTVEKVLVAEAISYERELYLSAILDRGSKRITMIASAEGGVEIEEVAKTNPSAIVKIAAHPTMGLLDFQARELAFRIGLRDGKQARQFAQIAGALYRAFVESDASLAEINPLVIKNDGNLLALDSKVLLDESGLFRHPDLAALRDPSAEPEAERRAREADITFIKLDGNIGCMVNGAGLAMATMDVIKLSGGEPANFLDIGGGAGKEKVKAALQIILSDPNVKAVLFNIFGGITRVDEVARGILAALEEVPTDVPMVARLVGTNEEVGRALLAGSKLIPAATLAEGAQKAVAAARGELVS